MAVEVTRTLICDICGDHDPELDRIDLEIRELRQRGKAHGWLYQRLVRGWTDICRNCAPAYERA